VSDIEWADMTSEIERLRERVAEMRAERDTALEQVAGLREALRCVERACLDQQCAAKEYKLDVGLPYLQLALDFARAALASTPAPGILRRVAEREGFRSDCDRECSVLTFKAGYGHPVRHSKFCKHFEEATR
jgi:hypothetical protein